MLPDEDTIRWIFDSSAWWLENFGGFDQFREHTILVTPTEEDFPIDRDRRGHALVEDYFEFVKEHAGVTEWPLVVVPEQALNAAKILEGMPHHMTEATMFSDEPQLIEEGEPLTIPYDPAQIGHPENLVASLALGVSHYLLHSASTLPSEQREELECFVELGAVLMGFGVFLANTRFRAYQTDNGMLISQGFSTNGTLSEVQLSYGLALFASLLDLDDEEMQTHLRLNPRSYYATARRDIRKNRQPELDRLRRSIEVPSQGPYR